MLGKNDRLVFERGSCSFQSSRGQKISVGEKISWQKPTAKIDQIIADLLAEHIGRLCDCTLEVEYQVHGFTLHFRSAPSLSTKDVTAFAARLDDVNGRRSRANRPELPDAKSLVNAEGAEAVNWFLKALFGKDFTFEPTSSQLAWNPPAKKEGYQPLNPPKGGELSQVDKIMAVLLPPKPAQGPKKR